MSDDLKYIREKKLKNGESLFELRIVKRGKEPYSKSFSTLEEAQAQKNIILGRIAEGKTPINRRAEKYTIAEAVKEYFEKVKDIPKAERYRLNMIEETMSNKLMSEITHEQVAYVISRMLTLKVPKPKNKTKDHPLYSQAEKTYAPATVRKFYFTLKKLVIWHAVKHLYTLQEYAFELQKVPEGWSEPRKRRLEAGEEEKILEAVKKSYKNHAEWKCLILWALESGMRAQELLLTEWKDVYFENRYIRLRKEIVKTKTSRQIPLSLKAVEILREHEKTKKTTTDRMFWQWSNSSTLGKAFKVIIKNAELENPLTIHDLRHEAISRFFENTDYSQMEIRQISGHEDANTLSKYSHLRPEHAAEKMEKKTGKKYVEISVEEYKELMALKEKNLKLS